MLYIRKEDGTVAASYKYDAWGRVMSQGGFNSTLASFNPFRYRGYVYDEETGLYYLQSRYYDPQVGRFIYADTITDGGSGILGVNILIYTANNPINNSDPSGHLFTKETIKWSAKNIIKPIVQKIKNTLSSLGDITYSAAICGYRSITNASNI